MNSPARLLRSLVLVVAAIVAVAISTNAALARNARVAVFPFALKDTSIEGEVGGVDPAQTARLEIITREVADKLAARGVSIVDLSGHEEAIAHLQAPWDCLDCATPIARSAGAGVGLTGFVHKVSTLIQSISIIAHDTETGAMLGNASVSIRGNTDEAWRHGVDYIVKNALWGGRVEAAMTE